MKLQSVMQVLLIISMLIATFVIYRFNVRQTERQKELVEKFVEKVAKQNAIITKTDGEHLKNIDEPRPFSDDDYDVYKKIIAVFKHEVGKPPSEEELFKCFQKFKDNTMDSKGLTNLLRKDPKNYHVKLFPEVVAQDSSSKKVVVESFQEQQDTEVEPDVKEQEDADPSSEPVVLPMNVENEAEADMIESSRVEKKINTSPEDKEYLLNDSKNQYIFNRPTIYNIMHPDATEQTFKSITTMAKNLPSTSTDAYGPGANGVDTTALIEAIKKIANDDGDNDDDDDEDDVEEQRVESYKNRCQTEEEFAEQNKLAHKQEKRNLNELKFACNRRKYANDDNYNFDDMVLRHDQSWKMPYQKPPVCHMNSKQKCSVNPVQTQTALIGTLLSDAKNTKVGSIMPDFKFSENDETKKKSKKK